MAEISLKEYLARAENLLKDRASDEAIHHCRHILKYYPKNVAAYRYLGRALLDNSRWNDVREIFSRVLSAIPDDATAHLGLSEVYRHTNQLDDAIWHLERAFEQDPGNEGIIGNLRELYRSHRNADYPRVQLTAGAVARQYARNGLYDQAIDTLHQALTKTPDRVDLRLLLARILWDSGYRVDGAETALEVLSTLPDCLDANRVLTDLWLSEGRPSDAQRYLSRIEALDPYLALELAQGQAPPDDILRLQELDYERAARRELTTNAPDWLGELGDSSGEVAVPTTDTSDWLGSFTEPATEEEVPDFQLDDDDIFGTALPDDWLTDAAPTAEPSIVEPPTSNIPPPRTRTGKTGLLSTFELPEPEPMPEEEFPPTDEIAQPVMGQSPIDLFADLPDDVETTTDVPDLFSDLEAEEPAPVSTPDNDDPLAWMHQSGIELVENAETAIEDPLGADDEFIIQEPDQANPLAWLQGYGGDDNIIAEEAEAGVVALDEEADALAWLHSSGIETIDDATPDAQPVQSAVQSEDEALLDWLADDSLLDEVLHMESLSTSSVDMPEAELETPVADQFAYSEPAAIQEGDMPGENDNEFDWLSEQPADSESKSDEFDWAADKPSSEAAPSSGDADLEWMAQSETAAEPVADSSDWLSEIAPADEQAEPQTGDDSLEWMAQAESDVSEIASAGEPAQPEADTGFEWMSEEEAAESAASDDWMSAMAPIEEPEEVAATDSPDWLSEIAPADEPQANEPAASADAGFDWLSEAAPAAEQPENQATDSSFEWMAEAQPGDSPDWLSELAPAGDEPEQVEPAPAADTSFEWAGDAAASAGDSPDWLSEIAPADEPQANEPVTSADAGFDWLSEAAPVAEQPEAQATDSSFEWMAQAEAQPGDSPDWLSELAPAGEEPEQIEPAPAADTSFEWAGDAAAVATDAPGWLSELAPADEPGEGEPASAEADQDWMAEAEPLPTADAPDWLSELAPNEEPEEVEPALAADTNFEWAGDAAAVATDAPGWLSELGPTDELGESEPASAEAGQDWMAEAEPLPTADAPGWLSELAPTEEPEEVEPAPAADTNFEWMGGTEDAAQAVPTDTPDWLTELAPSEEQEETEYAGSDWQAAQDEPEWITDIKTQTSEVKAVEPEPAVVSEFGWLNEMNEQEQQPTPESNFEATSFNQEELAPVPAENAPDWLNAMVPGLDVDYDAPEDEPIEQEYIESPVSRRLEAEAAVSAPGPARDFDWLNEIVAEESLQQGQPARERRRFVFSRQPAWLRRPVEKQDAPVATQQVADDDPDWLLDADNPTDSDDFELPPWLQ